MDTTVLAEIEELRALHVASLRMRYQKLFGEESRSSNKQFLFRCIAWRLQANSEGGLSERARLRATEIADDADLRTRAPKGFVVPSAPGGAPCPVDHPMGLAIFEQPLQGPGVRALRR